MRATYYDYDIPSYNFCADMVKFNGAFVTPGDCFEEPKSFRVGYGYSDDPDAVVVDKRRGTGLGLHDGQMRLGIDPFHEGGEVLAHNAAAAMKNRIGMGKGIGGHRLIEHAAGDEVVIAVGQQIASQLLVLGNAPTQADARQRPQVDVLHLEKENGYHVDVEALDALCTPDTKLICINNPDNPTGALLDGETLRAIVEVARKNDAWPESRSGRPSMSP